MGDRCREDVSFTKCLFIIGLIMVHRVQAEVGMNSWKEDSVSVMKKNKITLKTITILTLLLIFSQIAEARVGLIGAMEEEIDLLKGSMEIERTETIGNRIFFLGYYEGQDVVLAMSQVGKVNAAMTAQILIREFKVDQIIFTGIAGAVDKDLRPGDIVISTHLLQHDFGKVTDETFTYWPMEMPQADGSERSVPRFDAEPELVELAMKAGRQTDFQKIFLATSRSKENKWKPNVVEGVIVTGDQFISSLKKREWLREQFGASAVEMEGAAVAQVCVTYDVPFVVIRSISDWADDIAGGTYKLMKNTAANNSAMLVMNMLKGMGQKQPERQD